MSVVSWCQGFRGLVVSLVSWFGGVSGFMVSWFPRFRGVNGFIVSCVSWFHRFFTLVIVKFLQERLQIQPY